MSRDVWKVPAAAVALGLLNAMLVWPLFGTEYSNQMGSIEAAFLSIARYIQVHFPHLDWFPIWYNGIPYQNSYPPLLHLSVAALAAFAHISNGLAYHALTASLYCLGPVMLFLLAWRLSGSWAQALFAGLLYSLFSPSYFLIADVHKDALHLAGARRLQVLFEYGEGPHITSLALLLVSLLCLDEAVRKGGLWRWLLCAAALVATVLSNWIGAFALAVAFLCYLLARRKGWREAGTTGVFAYLLAAPWIPPSTLSAIAFNSQYVEGRFEFTSRHLLYMAAFALLIGAVAWLLGRVKAAFEIRFTLLMAVIFGAVVLGWHWWHLAVVPQPHRYHLELDIAVCLLAAAVGERLTRWLPSRLRLLLGAALALACIPLAIDLQGTTAPAIRSIDIRKTSDYRAAVWVQEHLPRARVYAAGETSFWLNAFSDAAQMAGGFDQGDIDHPMRFIRYQLMKREDAATSLVWLRIFGCDAVVVNSSETDQGENPFAFPRKFDGVLPVLWREKEYTVYGVPRKHPSLAHVVRENELVAAFNPNTEFLRDVQPLLAAVEDPARPDAPFEWLNTHEARISTTMEPDQLLAVAVAYHPGWHASVAGEARKTRSDTLGQTIIEARCSGACVVELTYDGGVEMKLLRAISWTLLAGALATALNRMRERSA